MRHVLFCAAGFVFLLAALLLWATPTGAAFDCVIFSIPCFAAAFWPGTTKL